MAQKGRNSPKTLRYQAETRLYRDGEARRENKKRTTEKEKSFGPFLFTLAKKRDRNQSYSEKRVGAVVKNVPVAHSTRCPIQWEMRAQTRKTTALRWSSSNPQAHHHTEGSPARMATPARFQTLVQDIARNRLSTLSAYAAAKVCLGARRGPVAPRTAIRKSRLVRRQGRVASTRSRSSGPVVTLGDLADIVSLTAHSIDDAFQHVFTPSRDTDDDDLLDGNASLPVVPPHQSRVETRYQDREKDRDQDEHDSENENDGALSDKTVSVQRYPLHVAGPRDHVDVVSWGLMLDYLGHLVLDGQCISFHVVIGDPKDDGHTFFVTRTPDGRLRSLLVAPTASLHAVSDCDRHIALASHMTRRWLDDPLLAHDTLSFGAVETTGMHYTVDDYACAMALYDQWALASSFPLRDGPSDGSRILLQTDPDKWGRNAIALAPLHTLMTGAGDQRWQNAGESRELVLPLHTVWRLWPTAMQHAAHYICSLSCYPTVMSVPLLPPPLTSTQ